MTQFMFAGESYEANRIIGDIQGDAGGPTIVFTGGIHGNEASGVVALQKACRHLQSIQPKVTGRILALAGNLAALEQNVRFIDADLNRVWTRENIDSIGSDSPNRALKMLSEYRELKELYAIIRPVFEDTPAAVFLDLHTTSSRSVPFIGVNDFPGSREFAKNFSPPTILGLDSYLEGPLLAYAAALGHVAMAFEAGQHDDPQSVKTHESFIYQALITSGVIDEDLVPVSFSQMPVRPNSTSDSPSSSQLYEVIYRHPVAASDGFAMKPGFENLEPIKKGELVAESNAGEILAPDDGLMFMPLYQPVGSDGFFLVRPVTS